MKASPPLALALIVCSAPAFAATGSGITVTSPANSNVGTTFVLTANASSCSSQSISAMGYSIDYGNTTVVNSTSMNLAVYSGTGAHTLHVKSWGNGGAGCDLDIPVNVSSSGGGTNVVVSQPSPGATVPTNFNIAASGSQCNSQQIAAMGFSLDNSPNTTIVGGGTLNSSLTSGTGAHTLHVKSWGTGGSGCVTDVGVNVIASNLPSIPSSATAVNQIQTLTNWTAAFDIGTGSGASAWGTMQLLGVPLFNATARQFNTSYSNYGGERYYVEFGADTSATNFFYDTYVMVSSPSTDVANIEMDMNQVMANGQTVIFGFQCDGWSQTWDYTANLGSAQNYNDQWLHTSQQCNPQNWSTNTWHHIQVSYSRDSWGNVTYKSVWLDGTEQVINVTAYSAFALGWSPSLITNLQIDGKTASQGGATVSLANLSITRW